MRRGPSTSGARRLFRRWAGRAPSRAFKVPTPRLDVVAVLGTARELSYLSNKGDGTTREYVHKFKTKPVLVSSPDGKFLGIFSRPPKRLVTSRGIIG